MVQGWNPKTSKVLKYAKIWLVLLKPSPVGTECILLWFIRLVTLLGDLGWCCICIVWCPNQNINQHLLPFPTCHESKRPMPAIGPTQTQARINLISTDFSSHPTLSDPKLPSNSITSCPWPSAANYSLTWSPSQYKHRAHRGAIISSADLNPHLPSPFRHPSPTPPDWTAEIKATKSYADFHILRPSVAPA